MNRAIISGGLTVSAAELVPTVEWALSGFRGPVPANLSALIAGALVMSLHAAYNYLAARAAAKAAVTAPPAP